MRSLRRYSADDFAFVRFNDPIDVTPLEEWRNHPMADKMFLLPISFIKLFADPGRISLLKRTEHELAWMDEIRASIAADGLLHPCTMVFDLNGKVRLKDGYHRLIVSEDFDWLTEFPVILKQVDKVSGYGRPFNELVGAVFTSAFTKETTPQPKRFKASFETSYRNFSYEPPIQVQHGQGQNQAN